MTPEPNDPPRAAEGTIARSFGLPWPLGGAGSGMAPLRADIEAIFKEEMENAAKKRGLYLEPGAIRKLQSNLHLLTELTFSMMVQSKEVQRSLVIDLCEKIATWAAGRHSDRRLRKRDVASFFDSL